MQSIMGSQNFNHSGSPGTVWNSTFITTLRREPLEKDMKFIVNSIVRKSILKSVPVETAAWNWEDLDNL
jgi:hypothetical protein